jgi:hypothetical protein
LTFKIDADNTNCTACTAGQYQPLGGETTCLNCPIGKYQTEMGCRIVCLAFLGRMRTNRARQHAKPAVQDCTKMSQECLCVNNAPLVLVKVIQVKRRAQNAVPVNSTM